MRQSYIALNLRQDQLTRSTSGANQTISGWVLVEKRDWELLSPFRGYSGLLRFALSAPHGFLEQHHNMRHCSIVEI